MAKKIVNNHRLSAHARKERNRLIVDAYRSKEPISSIAARIKVSVATMHNVITANGGSDRMRYLTDQQKQEAYSRYLKGESAVNIADDLGIHPGAVYSELKRHGAARRDRHACRRVHRLREDAFDIWDEEACYWAGFLMTDGCIQTRKNSHIISLRLAEKDRAHIESFRDFLGSDHPIIRVDGKTTICNGRKVRGGPCYHFAFNSTQIGQQLILRGIVPRKTPIAEAIGLEMSRHFWRGAVDGDGSLYWIWDAKDGRRYRYPGLCLVGARPLIGQFTDFAENILGYRPANRHRTIWEVRFKCRSAILLADALYSDCRIALDRKLKLAEQFLALKKP